MEQENCVICFEPLDKKIKILKCNGNHRFHENCTVNWLANNNSCPLCREKITLDTFLSQEQISIFKDTGVDNMFTEPTNQQFLFNTLKTLTDVMEQNSQIKKLDYKKGIENVFREDLGNTIKTTFNLKDKDIEKMIKYFNQNGVFRNFDKIIDHR